MKDTTSTLDWMFIAAFVPPFFLGVVEMASPWGSESVMLSFPWVWLIWEEGQTLLLAPAIVFWSLLGVAMMQFPLYVLYVSRAAQKERVRQAFAVLAILHAVAFCSCFALDAARRQIPYVPSSGDGFFCVVAENLQQQPEPYSGGAPPVRARRWI